MMGLFSGNMSLARGSERQVENDDVIFTEQKNFTKLKP